MEISQVRKGSKIIMKKVLGISAAMILLLAAATGCGEQPSGGASSGTDTSGTSATTAPTTQAAEAPSAQAGKIVDNVYTSEDSSYQITVPDGWKTTSVIAGVVQFVAGDYPTTVDSLSVTVTPGTIPPGSADDMKEIYAETFQQLGEGFEWMDFDSVEVNGLTGLKMNYKLTVAGVNAEYYQTMLSKDGTLYALTAVFNGDAAAKQALIDSIGSFKVL